MNRFDFQTRFKNLRSAGFLLVALCCAVHPSVWAANSNAGTKNGVFLKLPTDARGVALGEAMVSLAEGAESMRWNPAGLALTELREVSASHVEYYQDVSIENVSFAYPTGDSAIGASAFYLNPGTLDGRNSLGAETGGFNYYNLVGSLGYGRRISSRLEGSMDVMIGGAIKFVQEKIADQSYQNPAFDIGLLFSPIDDFMAGFSARNLSTGKANFPRELTAGASYLFFKYVTGAVNVRHTNDGPLRYSIGAEGKIPELQNTALRVGYKSRDELDDSEDSAIKAFRGASVAGLTLGAGMEYEPPFTKGLKLQADYAMAPFGALGIAHYITLKAKW